MSKKIILLLMIFMTASYGCGRICTSFHIKNPLIKKVYADDSKNNNLDTDEEPEGNRDKKQEEYNKQQEELNKQLEYQKNNKPDALLKTLHFDKDISIDFEPEIYKYFINVSDYDEDILIKAQPQYKSDKVYVNDVEVKQDDKYRTFVNLQPGKNTILIKVEDSYNGDITTYVLYVFRGTEKHIKFEDVTMNESDIGFEPDTTFYNLELDEDDTAIRLKFTPPIGNYTIKVNNTVLNETNGIKLNFGGINKYTVKVILIDNDINKGNTYILNFYVGIPVSPSVEEAINQVLKPNQWIQVNGRWRYNDYKGDYIKSTWLYDERYRKYFYFNERGYMQTGWLKCDDGNTYYLNAHGAMQTGWILYEEQWYYFDKNGVMRTGWIKDKNKWYYLDTRGVMQTSWLYNSGKWYYLNSDGSMETGWIIYKGNYYYLGEDGAAQTGWLKYNGSFYYMNPESAEMICGKWIKYEGSWYYLNSNGTMRTGWFLQNNKMYYLNSDGRMNTEDKIIDGYKCTFNKDGSVNLK